ncbi:ThuA domain-containing protein [Microbacterium sp. CPCC 204701]|uniref:ThuA domain-containing protein n=1 Tax=Microbacterium sp. CPCC 204701 TaxID=2493084 RepID=UPI000FDAF3FD|nr:ThuA domain-containing protein [Microbacterium sp. CPCC 204701]
MKFRVLSGVALASAATLGIGMLTGGAAVSSIGTSTQVTAVSAAAVDPVYGVCRGLDPECFNEDGGNGWVEGEEKRVLIWSRTAGPRHAHLGTPLPPGLNPPLATNNVAQAALKSWLVGRGIAVDYTEDLSQFTDLERYQTVINLSGNRDTFDPAAEAELVGYLQGGGGFVGIHNAFGAEYDWPYYEGLLGNANFLNHGPNREGTVEVINDQDVSTSFMPDTWQFKDEFYNLDPFPTNVNVLLEVDPVTSMARPQGHGAVHPLSWCQYYDGAKAWLTTLGHDAAAWTDAPLPGEEFFAQHVIAGIESTMGIQPFCAAPADNVPEVSVTPRMLGSTVYVSVSATNTAAVPATIKVEASFGSKTFTNVAPDATVSVSLNTRVKTLPLPTGSVTVTATGERFGNPFTATATGGYDSYYGVCRGVDAECFNEEGGNGWVEGEDKRVLIWSRTAGPRHAHLGSPLPAGLNPPLAANNVAQAALKSWLEESGIAVDYTEDLTQFTNLERYQTVINLSGNRDTFDPAAQDRLVAYVRGGGGFVGIHNAFGAEYDWKYYEGLLGNANFLNHGPNREGTVEVINNRDTSTSFMPETWLFKDEWYNLRPFPDGVNVLLEVDPVTSQARPDGHGEHHPISWCQYYDGAKAWLTTLGHDVAAWTDAPLPGDQFFKQHVVAGIHSTMGITPFCAA